VYSDALSRSAGILTGSLSVGTTNTYDLGTASLFFRSTYLRTSVVLGQTTANYTLTWANPAAARAISIADPGGTDVFTFNAASQTLTNKTLTAPVLSGTVTGTYTLGGTPTIGAALLPDGDNTRDVGSAAASWASAWFDGALAVGGVATFTSQPILPSLTASLPVFTDGSKGLVSNAMTGTGSVVMAGSPTITTPVIALINSDLSVVGTIESADATTPILSTASGKTNTGYLSLLGKTSGALKVLPADAMAQVVTIAGATQTVGATTLTIPDQAGVSSDFVFTTLAQTLTNKSISLASNTITATSAELITAISDETGSGLAVFGTSPNLIAPVTVSTNLRISISGNNYTLETLANPSTLAFSTYDGSAHTTTIAQTGSWTFPVGITAGSGAVGIIDSTGKIPAISTTYFASVSGANLTSIPNSATTATSANTVSTIVARDAGGDFAAGTVTALLTGNASTATALQTARTIAGVSFDGTANIAIASTGLSDTADLARLSANNTFSGAGTRTTTTQSTSNGAAVSYKMVGKDSDTTARTVLLGVGLFDNNAFSTSNGASELVRMGISTGAMTYYGASFVFAAATSFTIGATALKVHGATGGVSIGDATDPGATNFRVAGTSTLVGATTSASFIPTSSTAPTNGMYLSAANTTAIAADGFLVFKVTGTNSLGALDSATATIGSFVISSSTSGGLPRANSITAGSHSINMQTSGTLIITGNTWPTTASAANAYIADGAALSLSTSVRAAKQDFQAISDIDAIRTVMALRGLTYRSALRGDDQTRHWAGFVAEDVEQANPVLAAYDANGRLQGVTYDRVPAYLVPIAQSHERRIAALEAELAGLKARAY